jgi:hypothetical protein
MATSAKPFTWLRQQAWEHFLAVSYDAEHYPILNDVDRLPRSLPEAEYQRSSNIALHDADVRNGYKQTQLTPEEWEMLGLNSASNRAGAQTREDHLRKADEIGLRRVTAAALLYVLEAERLPNLDAQNPRQAFIERVTNKRAEIKKVFGVGRLPRVDALHEKLVLPVAEALYPNSGDTSSGTYLRSWLNAQRHVQNQLNSDTSIARIEGEVARKTPQDLLQRSVTEQYACELQLPLDKEALELWQATMDSFLDADNSAVVRHIRKIPGFSDFSGTPGADADWPERRMSIARAIDDGAEREQARTMGWDQH